MRDLVGRRALVTGATGGLGEYIVRELARAGVQVAISSRSRAALDELASRSRGLGAAVVPFPADLSLPGAAERLAAAVEENLGPPDILVNNAGLELASSFTRYSPAELDLILAVDLLAPLQLTHRLLPSMLARRAGHVVNICSLASKGPLPYGVPYAAAKSGLAGATASLRAEYAGTGVGFSAVIPGFVTGAGIFARHQAAGVAAPAVFGTTTPQRVARAVLAAIRRDIPETIVTPYPIRPLLALAELAPATAQRLTALVGVTGVAHRVARLNERTVDPPADSDTPDGDPRPAAGRGPHSPPPDERAEPLRHMSLSLRLRWLMRRTGRQRFRDRVDERQS